MVGGYRRTSVEETKVVTQCGALAGKRPRQIGKAPKAPNNDNDDDEGFQAGSDHPREVAGRPALVHDQQPNRFSGVEEEEHSSKVKFAKPLERKKRQERFYSEAPFPKPRPKRTIREGGENPEDLAGVMVSNEVDEVFRGAKTDLDKYLALRGLHARNPRAYRRLLVERTEEVLPYIYTPTVGEACQKYSNLDIETTGLYVTLEDRGRVLEKLRSWKNGNEVRAIVVTDGERILGLGDLGAGGMGISEGKIQLYTAAAGVPPDQCLPICLDVGTNRESLLEDPEYKGLRRRRPMGVEYYSFLDEFVQALRAWRPHCLLQFEDFGNHTAFVLLGKYRNQLCCFNDDIQGTASINLAGILAGLRLKEGAFSEQKILFHGAGEAGVGCGELIALALSTWHGVPLPEARKRILFMDSKGLVCKSRLSQLQDHKVPFAHDLEHAPDLLQVVRKHKPTVLIGVSTQAGSFTEEVLRAMCENCNRPLIFPLSNPTSKAECTFEEAFAHTDGRCIFASGSPFPPLTVPSPDGMGQGTTYHPAQANNAYIFPAVGYAAILTEASCIPDDVFLEAAKCLAGLSSDEDLERGRLFPPFSKIRETSAHIMAHLCQFFCDEGYGTKPQELRTGEEADWLQYVKKRMYNPSY